MNLREFKCIHGVYVCRVWSVLNLREIEFNKGYLNVLICRLRCSLFISAS